MGEYKREQVIQLLIRQLEALASIFDAAIVREVFDRWTDTSQVNWMAFKGMDQLSIVKTLRREHPLLSLKETKELTERHLVFRAHQAVGTLKVGKN